MHERIEAIHPAVAAAMSHVDTSQEPRLERIMSEIRTQRKRAQATRGTAAAEAPTGLNPLG
jgi:cell pole-organizing protein PopZ